MKKEEKILEIVKKQGKIDSADVAGLFSVSRQYAARLLKSLVDSGQLLRVGTTRSAYYLDLDYAKAHPELAVLHFKKTYLNQKLEEHLVLNQVEESLPAIKKLPENVRSIFTYAFSEMLNNAIEHSKSSRIEVEVSIKKGVLSFIVNDFGIGVFRNIMQKRKLNSEIEAIQDLFKGKTTTMPKSHSGEGIFFTSKAGDLFGLDSYGQELIVDNRLKDVVIKNKKKLKLGTMVSFDIKISSKSHLNDLFMEYTNLVDGGDFGFDKTDIRVALYEIGGVYVSRSQARRILSGLEKFKIIEFDFDRVPMVGQAFVDEIFRVFRQRHPGIQLQSVRMNDGVGFMVQRAINEAKKSKK